MDTATCVFTCRYWFSISRITCLIIFSGSSARSIMSLRFARIKVLTRSKSPMVMLLSNINSDHSLFPKAPASLRNSGQAEGGRYSPCSPKPGTLERSGDLGPGHIDQDQHHEN